MEYNKKKNEYITNGQLLHELQNLEMKLGGMTAHNDTIITKATKELDMMRTHIVSLEEAIYRSLTTEGQELLKLKLALQNKFDEMNIPAITNGIKDDLLKFGKEIESQRTHVAEMNLRNRSLKEDLIELKTTCIYIKNAGNKQNYITVLVYVSLCTFLLQAVLLFRILIHLN